MPNSPQNVRQQGFTLIEFIVVLVLIASLAALAIPRFSTSDNTLVAQAFRLARDLRHVQTMAMNQSRTLVFDVQSISTYRVTFAGSTVTDPANMRPYTVTLDNNVTISGADTAIDSMGRPVSAGTLLAMERVFTLIGDSRSTTVTLSPVTGFVTVTP